MLVTCNEAGILLAIDALKERNRLIICTAAKIFNVTTTTLRYRLYKSKKLTSLKEKVLIKYILDLDSRTSSPRLCGIEDIANILLQQRGGELVGKN
jgi:hypothetical protein